MLHSYAKKIYAHCEYILIYSNSLMAMRMLERLPVYRDHYLWQCDQEPLVLCRRSCLQGYGSDLLSRIAPHQGRPIFIMHHDDFPRAREIEQGQTSSHTWHYICARRTSQYYALSRYKVAKYLVCYGCVRFLLRQTKIISQCRSSS